MLLHSHSGFRLYRTLSTRFEFPLNRGVVMSIECGGHTMGVGLEDPHKPGSSAAPQMDSVTDAMRYFSLWVDNEETDCSPSGGHMMYQAHHSVYQEEVSLATNSLLFQTRYIEPGRFIVPFGDSTQVIEMTYVLTPLAMDVVYRNPEESTDDVCFDAELNLVTGRLDNVQFDINDENEEDYDE